MSDDDRTRQAWIHPLTPGGIARFSELSFKGITLYVLLFGLIGATSILLLIQQVLLLHVPAAIEALPESGDLTQGRLNWPFTQKVQVLHNPFLEILVLPSDNQNGVSTSDFMILVYPDTIRIESLLGYVKLSYPDIISLEVNRTEWQPAWGAWEPFAPILAFIAAFVVIVGSWFVLAGLYAIPIRFLSSFRNADLNWMATFQVGLGTLLPGSVVASVAISLYAFRAINMSAFLTLMALHLVLGWILVLVVSPLIPATHTPKVAGKNPFGKRKKKKNV